MRSVSNSQVDARPTKVVYIGRSLVPQVYKIKPSARFKSSFSHEYENRV
nr:MAG TPA: hypothetical protein [Caudoviricetes sp.]